MIDKTKLATCGRCGALGSAGKKPNPDGRLMVYAETPANALCADCAATAFIKSVETMMAGIEQNGTGVLLMPHIQAAFGQLMKVGNADARPEEINWQRVVELWELPIPKAKRAHG
jgi:hypothetical protein